MPHGLTFWGICSSICHIHGLFGFVTALYFVFYRELRINVVIPVHVFQIMDKLLDKEVHQLYKAPSLVNYLSSKPVSSHSVTCSPTAVLTTPSSQPAIVTASAAVARSPDMDDLFLPEQRSTDLRTQEDESIEEIPTASALQQSLDYVSRAQPGQPTPQFSSQGASRPKTMYSLYNRYNRFH